MIIIRSAGLKPASHRHAMKIFIVIPCYNEARHLAKVIESAKPYGQVLVVDDGSVDNSSAVAEASGAIVLKHFINRGQGASLETGDRFAYGQGAEAVVHFDADGQHLAAEIPFVLEPILTGEAEVVFGSRFLPGNSSKIPWFKKWLILKPAVVFQNYLLKLKLTDAHNGFRALSSRALGKIFITQDGMAHPSEIIEQVKKAGLKYKEVPVTILYKEFGQGFAGGLKILKDLFFSKINNK